MTPKGPAEAREIVFELCVETPEALRAARPGGAGRVELCARLEVGGVTPSEELIAEAIGRSGVAVHVLVRPRGGDYFADPATFRAAKQSVRRAQELGAAGVVLGFLGRDLRVDRERMRELVELAGPLEVDFHRAFDVAADREEALEELVALGCKRVLTSGGAPDVLSGARTLEKLRLQAAGRIEVAAGGGLRVGNARELARAWGGKHHHGSLGGAGDGAEALTGRVRQVIAELRGTGFQG